MLNVSKLKHFFKTVTNSEEEEDASKNFNQTANNFNKAQDAYRDLFNQVQLSGPITRAQAKLIKYKDAAQLALQLLKSEEMPNIDTLCDASDYCAEC